MSETTKEIRSGEPASEDRSPGDEAEAQRRVKVTDKRMFRPDGELREEYSFLNQGTRRAPEGEPVSPPEPPPPAQPRAQPSVHQDPPADAGRFERPAFFDLISVLAEPVAVYLGDVKLPGGQMAENLDMARLHIDLLEVLQEKTRGNLTAEENSVLDDLLYRLRMRYVQKSGR